MEKTRDTGATERTDSDLPTTTIFGLLANHRRQLALQYLTSKVGAVPLSELANQIALREGEHTKERCERICTGLVHVHLPKLADAGIVRYDPNRETIELQETADQLAPFLELAEPTDSL